MLDVNWGLFFIASLTINAIPGADVVYVTGNFHLSGWRAACSSALGLALGYYFYVFITWIGVTAILISIPILYTVIQLIGAIYLMWMGYSIYQSSPIQIHDHKQEAENGVKSIGYLMNGAVISILNPKVGVFFVSFFPQFINKNSPSYLLLVLGTFFCLGATFFNIFYCLITEKLRRLSPKKMGIILARVPGIILMILGAFMVIDVAVVNLMQH